MNVETMLFIKIDKLQIFVCELYNLNCKRLCTCQVLVLSDPLPIKTVFAQHAYITTPYLNCKELSKNSSWDI